MHIDVVRVRNFRRLKDVRIDLANDISIFVGANNSGKTSAAHLLDLFLGSSKERFTLFDFNAESWPQIEGVEAGTEGVELPEISLDLWFHVDESDLHRVIDLLPSLDWQGTRIGVRIAFVPKDSAQTLADYRKLRAQALAVVPQKDGQHIHNPFPESLRAYIEANLNREYELRYFVLDHAKFDANLNAEPGYIPQFLGGDHGRGGKDILAGLVKVDFLAAQRRLDDRHGGNRGEDLSKRLSRYYRRSLEKSQEDYTALQSLASAVTSLNEHLQRVFRSTFAQLEKLGYPGLTNPHMVIKTTLSPEAIMGSGDGAKVYYALDLPEAGQDPLTLPDQHNGLGYKNLIYMVVELLDLHQQWRDIGTERPPLHFVIIEEPEAHLHAQLQQVFISQVLELIKIDKPEADSHRSQLVVTTHSPHVLYQRGFRPIRYFRRRDVKGSHTTDVQNLSVFYDQIPDSRDFLERYLRLTHCDLFFADAAVLVEGNVERILLPQMIERAAPRLKTAYLSILEVGGAFGYLFKELVEFLGIAALIVTDIDSVHGKPELAAANNNEAAVEVVAPAEDEEDDDIEAEGALNMPGTACIVGTEGAVTSNQTLIRWLPKITTVAGLLGASEAARTQLPAKAGDAHVLVSYQSPVSVTWGETTGQHTGRTLEEAFALENLTWCQDAARKSLGLRIPKANTLTREQIAERLHKRVKSQSFKKTDFALALLTMDPAGWVVPAYIVSGLGWLERMVVPAGEAPGDKPVGQEVGQVA